jgi:hypothetical protein
VKIPPEELGAYIEYLRAVVKAKVKAGYAYRARSIFDMSESQRMEWITYKSMLPSQPRRICCPKEAAPSRGVHAQAAIQGTVLQIQRHLRTLVAAPKQSDVIRPRSYDE